MPAIEDKEASHSGHGDRPPWVSLLEVIERPTLLFFFLDTMGCPEILKWCPWQPLVPAAIFAALIRVFQVMKDRVLSAMICIYVQVGCPLMRMLRALVLFSDRPSKIGVVHYKLYEGAQMWLMLPVRLKRLCPAASPLSWRSWPGRPWGWGAPSHNFHYLFFWQQWGCSGCGLKRYYIDFFHGSCLHKSCILAVSANVASQPNFNSNGVCHIF